MLIDFDLTVDWRRVWEEEGKAFEDKENVCPGSPFGKLKTVSVDDFSGLSDTPSFHRGMF